MNANDRLSPAGRIYRERMQSAGVLVPCAQSLPPIALPPNTPVLRLDARGSRVAEWRAKRELEAIEAEIGRAEFGGEA